MKLSNQLLRILSIGAGAIGTYVGGSLALAGHRVVFSTRSQTAKALRRRPMYLNLLGEEKEINQPIIASSIEDAINLGPFDVALFALKSYDTENALEQMEPFTHDLPSFFCLQNGVDNETTIAKVLGWDKVIYGTVTSAVGRREVGNIVLERLGGVGVAAGHPLSERLVVALDRAGLNATLYPKAEDMKWSKMLTNLVSNATSAILDMTPAEIFSHSGLFRLETQMLRECLNVMRAQGFGVTDLPGTPVKLLANAVRYLPSFVYRAVMKQKVGKGRGDKMPSFHIDLHSGRGKSEVTYLNGAVVRVGQKLDIPTPVNQLLTEILMKITQGELDKEEFRKKPQNLLTLLYK